MEGIAAALAAALVKWVVERLVSASMNSKVCLSSLEPNDRFVFKKVICSIAAQWEDVFGSF